MAHSSTRLHSIFSALSLICLQAGTALSSALSETAGKDITTLLTTDPRLKKARQWAEDSGILEQIDFSMYGGKMTLVLPSNDAFEEFERDHPTWREKLISDSADIEILLLFASTDHRISVEDVKKGEYEEPESIISILSEYSSISREGKLCVSGSTRVLPCDHPESLPCCAHVDMDQPIKAANGNIYLIDKVLLPQELIDKLQAE